ncbi:MAG: hypothetical protein V1792_10060 [Pseudomonadota bacterium]
MKHRLLKKSSVLFVVILLSLMSGVALAQEKHWFVVKDKAGMCQVIEVATVLEPFITIAGPFKTKAEAETRKAKDCQKGAGQATEPQRSPQQQAEPMPRQHQQRDEVQQQHLKQQQAPQQRREQAEPMPRQHQQREGAQQQQPEKMKGKTQEKREGVKPSEKRSKEKAKEPIPSDKKN